MEHSKRLEQSKNKIGRKSVSTIGLGAHIFEFESEARRRMVRAVAMRANREETGREFWARTGAELDPFR
jgi:hypothetical protein